MITDETRPEDFQKPRKADFSHINGWGIDADPLNDPTYPIKMRTDEEQKGYSWKRPEQQPENVEILKSVERPNLTAVFGTSAPPSGLSGLLRRLAFKYSESSYGRWLPLVLADRIGVAEGIADDLKRGYIPNILAEKGWGAEWKYNKKAAIEKIVVAAVIATAVTAYFVSKHNKRKAI